MNARRVSLYLLLAGSVALYLLDPFIRISSKNLLPSDVLFVASALFLMSSYKNFLRFETELTSLPGMNAFAAFLLASMFGFLITSLRRSVSSSFHFASAAQLVFTFVLLGPLVLAHKNDISDAKKLWLVHLWLIPFAGLLSLTDFVGLTNLGEQIGERHFNVILDSTFVNGFWVFGLASPFLLQKMFPFRLTTLFYGALWLFGCCGSMLAGTRTAIVVIALSVVFIAWLNLGSILRDKRVFAGFLLFLAVTVGGGLQMLDAFPVISARFQQTKDFFDAGQDDYSASLRQDQLQIVFHDLESKPLTWLGSGLKQYRLIHPEDEIEAIHNMYLQELYEAGLVGLIAFTLIFVAPLLKSGRCYLAAAAARDSEATKYWACCLFAVSAYLLMGFVYPTGYYRHFWLFLFLATPSSREYLKLKEFALQNPSRRNEVRG
jgi:O-antigen ligase